MAGLNTVINFLKHPKYLVIPFGKRGWLNFIPDKEYLRLLYRIYTGKKLNIKNPVTYNEKLQWLKLYDRKDIYTIMVDKSMVKEYVSEIIGEEHIIPTIGVWENFEDIDFNKLPNQFVLKCTHDSGGICICKDKEEFNYGEAEKTLKTSLKRNFYASSREWPYKNVKPRIICEAFLVDESGYELKDYKFFCFNGEVKVMFIATDRGVEGKEVKIDFYDREFNHLDLKSAHPNADREIKKPISFDRMIEYAEKLSQNIPQLRVDFYEVNGHIYFGELTFYHHSGFVDFEPEEWNKILGDWIILPTSK